jgi:hypothetical protein
MLYQWQSQPSPRREDKNPVDNAFDLSAGSSMIQVNGMVFQCDSLNLQIDKSKTLVKELTCCSDAAFCSQCNSTL